MFNQIQELYPDKKLLDIIQQDKGFRNSTFLIKWEDGNDILKIVPSKYGIPFESDFANTEIACGKQFDFAPSIKKVFSIDNRQAYLKEYIVGKEYSTQMRSGTVDKEIGLLMKKMHNISNNTFGRVGSKDQFNTMYDFLVYLFQQLYELDIHFPINKEELLQQLEKDKQIFGNIKPSLIHYDLNGNNIIIQNSHIVGIIDWERAMFADYLMEDQFRSPCQIKTVLHYYNKDVFSLEERKRILWYDLLLALIRAMENIYRKTFSDDQTAWCFEWAIKSWDELRS